MARTTFSVSFYARPAKASKKTGLSPLEMSIVINGKRIFLNLPYKVKPEELKKKRLSQEIMAIEDQYRVKVNDIILDLMRDKQPITANTIRDYIQTGGIKSMEICNLFDQYLTSIKKRVGVSMSSSVYRKYEMVRDVVYELLGEHKEITTITNSDMVYVYDTLKMRYKLSTAAGYFTKVKTIFTYAIDNGHMKINPFNGIKVDKGQPTIEYLTEEELNQIENTNLHGIERLEKVRDILLFQAYGGGMAYCDMAAFNPDNMSKVGKTYIYTGRRIKTGIEFTTVLLPKAIEILEKYDWKLPVISNQKMNAFLKEIQVIAGIKKNLHTHLFRKTYGHMMISHSVPITAIAKMLGHSGPTLTSKLYAVTTPEIVANEVARHLEI